MKKLTLGVADCWCCPGVVIPSSQGGEHTGPNPQAIPDNKTYAQVLSDFGFSTTGKDLCVYYRDAVNGATTTFPFWSANSGTPGSYNPDATNAPKYAVSLCGTSVGVDDNDRSLGGWRLPNIAELGQMSTAATGGAPKFSALTSDKGGDVRTTNMQSTYYWSITEYSTYGGMVWRYNGTGTNYGVKTSNFYVRCVSTMD
jgi:hypothetical protein